jgi:hypothetical protein
VTKEKIFAADVKLLITSSALKMNMFYKSKAILVTDLVAYRV